MAHTSGLVYSLSDVRKCLHQGEVLELASFFQAVHLSYSFTTIFGGSPVKCILNLLDI